MLVRTASHSRADIGSFTSLSQFCGGSTGQAAACIARLDRLGMPDKLTNRLRACQSDSRPPSLLAAPYRSARAPAGTLWMFLLKPMRSFPTEHVDQMQLSVER
jgi:hypothetical protein